VVQLLEEDDLTAASSISDAIVDGCEEALGNGRTGLRGRNSPASRLRPKILKLLF
jgi:hypothetical protein